MRSLLISLLVPSLAVAQSGGGRLKGFVTDSNGAAIQGAQVTVTAEGFREIAISDGEGRYTVPTRAGRFTVTVEADAFRKEEASAIDVKSDSDRNLDFVLKPAPSPEVPFIETVADAAARRPAFLADAGLSPGALVILQGGFEGVTEASGDDFRVEKGGLQLELSNAEGSLVPIPIRSVSKSEVQGIIPSTLTAGDWQVTAKIAGDKISKSVPVKILSWAPKLYSTNRLGFGTAKAVDSEGRAVTYTNPARPGGTYQFAINNNGAVPNDTEPDFHNKLEEYPSYGFKLGRNVFDKANIDYIGSSKIAGEGILQVTLPDATGAAEEQFGCAVPFQFRIGDRWSNQVTIPYSRAGNCGDLLSFDASEVSQLAAGLSVNRVQIIESSAFNGPNLIERIFGRGEAIRYREADYNPAAPPGNCSMRWLPAGASATSDAERLPFAGAFRLTVPWGLFDFSPASNAGPYSLVYGKPASFSNGNYSFEYQTGFSAGGQPFTGRYSGTYQRPAGQAVSLLADRVRRDEFSERSVTETVNYLVTAMLTEPDLKAAPVYYDWNFQVNNGSAGTHQVRCMVASGHEFDAAAEMEWLRAYLPRTARSADLVLRVVPRREEKIAHPAGSPLDQTRFSFEAILQLPRLNYLN